MTAAFLVSTMDSPSRDCGDGVMDFLPSTHEEHRTPPRSDLREAARKAEQILGRSGYLALRKVSCFAGRDELYLHGCLPSHYLKQLAQEIALGVEGVRRVINRISVLTPAGRGASGQETPLYSKLCVDLPHQSS
jgi:BON domain